MSRDTDIVAATVQYFAEELPLAKDPVVLATFLVSGMAVGLDLAQHYPATADSLRNALADGDTVAVASKLDEYMRRRELGETT